MALDLLLEQFDGLIQTPADVKKLEQTILEWAVMGRLVPQEPNDEPASVLLERIAVEKGRLVREKKIKKPKKLPPMSGEKIPFELPKEWSVCRLGEITMKLGAGSTPRGGKKVYTETGVKFLRSQNIWNNGLRLDRVAHIPHEINQRMFKTIVRPKDVLLNITGASIGRSVLVPDEFDLGNVSQHVAIVRPIEPETRFFIHLCLISPYIQRKIMEVQVGISREGLSMTQLKKFVLPIPPLEEQKRIVTRVDELFEQTRALATQLEAAQETRTRLQRAIVSQVVSTISISRPLEAPLAPPKPPSQDIRALLIAQFDHLHSQEADVKVLKQTILQLAVMGRLVPQDPNDEPASELLKRIATEKARLVREKKIRKRKKLAPISDEDIPFDIPENWAWARFPEIGELNRGKSKHRPRNDPSLYENGKYPFVQTGNVARSNGHITTYSQMYSEKGLAQSRMWPTGTLCITIAANIAETGILDFDACFPDSVVGFIPSELIGSVAYFQYIVQVAKQGLEKYAPSTAQKNINLGILQQLLIPIPPKNEIQRIVARVDELFALCDELAAGLESAEVMRGRFLDAVLAQAVSIDSNSNSAKPPVDNDKQPA